MMIFVKNWPWPPTTRHRYVPAATPKYRLAPRASSSHAGTETDSCCADCQDRGWLVCDFCKGQKTNVQVRKNKFYRRCPSCKAVGVVICPRCKVFRCVTFPDARDDDDRSLIQSRRGGA